MKIMMLGWELAPRSGGGLGVACRDIATTLVEQGVDLTLVTPCSPASPALEGAAPHEHIAADRVRPRRRRVRYRPMPAGQPAAQDHAVRGGLDWLAVESALQPYQTVDAYAAERASERRSGASSLRARPVPLVRMELEETDELDAPYPFSGGYGPKLLQEVERFARVVQDVAGTRAPDVIYAHDWMTWPAALRAGDATGAPIVLHVHSTELDRQGHRPDGRIRAVEEFAMRRADRVVCVSRLTAAVVCRRYGVPSAKVVVVHNGVPEDGQADAGTAGDGPQPSQDDPAPSTRRRTGPLVLYLGRLTRQKGPEHFLAAALRVRAEDPSVRFVVCGDGDLLPELVERAAELGLARAVRFTGFLERTEVQRILSMADVYVMPSVSEPFGLAALEAANAGVPVILSRQSGVAEVFESALKVDWWDAAEMASMILAVLHRPALRRVLVEGARADLDHLEWGSSAASLRGVFGEVVR